jgi:signal transduction histidine kinase
MISTIQSETARLTELTTAFLDLARLESKRAEFQITTFDLQPLLEELVQIIHPQAIQQQIDVHLHLPEQTLKLRGDRAKLKQALLNLMNNAVKYNQPQGTITVRAQPANGEILIQVQDTGLGIPEEEIPHLFEKFFRASNTLKVAPGTGLGLTIAKKIIENHGGKIEVQSQLGVGTTFITHLPAASSGN